MHCFSIYFFYFLTKLLIKKTSITISTIVYKIWNEMLHKFSFSIDFG